MAATSRPTLWAIAISGVLLFLPCATPPNPCLRPRSSKVLWSVIQYGQTAQRPWTACGGDRRDCDFGNWRNVGLRTVSYFAVARADNLAPLACVRCARHHYGCAALDRTGPCAARPTAAQRSYRRQRSGDTDHRKRSRCLVATRAMGSRGAYRVALSPVVVGERALQIDFRCGSSVHCCTDGCLDDNVRHRYPGRSGPYDHAANRALKRDPDSVALHVGSCRVVRSS